MEIEQQLGSGGRPTAPRTPKHNQERLAVGRRQAVPALAGGALWSLAAPASVPSSPNLPSQPDTIRFGLSESVVLDSINANDARAAMLVWIGRISAVIGLKGEFPPQVFYPPARIEEMLRAGLVDTVAVNLIEYRRMARWLEPSPLFVDSASAKQQYALLARAKDATDGSVSLAELRGKRLLVLRSPVMCVSTAWMASLLRPLEPAGMDRFFGSVTLETKPARVLLPVFFGQADACLTTMQTFSVMCELNPQLTRRLCPVAVSPGIVSTLYAFRKGYREAIRGRLAKALATLPDTPAGKQVLTMFQVEGLVAKDASHLRESLEILEQADRGLREGQR